VPASIFAPASASAPTSDPELSPLPPADNGYDDDEDRDNGFIDFSSFNNTRLEDRAL
jgi:hypothetical protein